MGLANWLASTLSAQMSLFAPEPTPAVLAPRPKPRRPVRGKGGNPGGNPLADAGLLEPLIAGGSESASSELVETNSQPNQLLVQHPPVNNATTFGGLGVPGLLQTVQEALLPSRFAHPQANRRVELGGHQVHFLFRRGKRKTIGFLVGPDGLVVSAPRWVLVGEVDGAVREKGDWILRKLQEVQERHQRQSEQRIEWRDGAALTFLGEPVVLVLDPQHAFSGSAQLQADAVPARLLVGLPHSASAEQMRDAVQAWLMRQAKRVFAERMAHFAPVLGVTYTKLRLSSAGTRWGSASADGSIRLNWRLVHYKPSIIDYVVVHELSHLRVMDHSPRFWDVVGSVMPDYSQRRAALKQDGRARWD
jgi:predicted metal-dependent hydrolase